MKKVKKIKAYGRSCRVIRDDDWDDLCFLNHALAKISIDSSIPTAKDLGRGLDTSPFSCRRVDENKSYSGTSDTSSVRLPILSCLSPAEQSANPRISKEATSAPKKSPHVECLKSPILTYLSPLRENKCKVVSAEEKVLALCGQSAPTAFDDYFDDDAKRSIKKLGEGVYSEVFCFQEGSVKLVVKIIPVEGKVLFNGEKLKTFDEILPEMAIAQELSNLGCTNQENSQQSLYFTASFLHITKFAVVAGCMPAVLIKEWERWDHQHKSENDHPRIFQADQLFVLFVSPHGGTDLEHFEFHSGAELMSVYQQTVAALAVAEQCLQFEHRDLHWGNVLVSPCSDAFVQFVLDGNPYKIKSHGVKVTIIDFTLSRLRRDECVLFFDLETISWLFEGQGDFQFEVYRMMRKETKKDWEGFYSHNNVFWLRYILEKLLGEVRGISCRSKDKDTSTLRRHRTLLKRNNYPSALQVFEILTV